MFRYSLFLLAAFTSLSMMASAQNLSVQFDLGRGPGQICRGDRYAYQIDRGYGRYRPRARCGTNRYYDQREDRRYRKWLRRQHRRQNRRYRNNYRCR